ncbi:GNAT family N-acetyltransferase [Robiginitalea sp. IMCC44478]|uniref:GNAT family N-acetyltransferase n=1 Tax=Robiginitalea sp. IMCC44478 TaxID=3459122 RepID=UPI0040413D13
MGNPFLSECFQWVWLSHFGEGRRLLQLVSIPDVPLIKHSRFPVFFNVGQTQTKGFTYTLDPNNTNSENKGKCIILYDIPSYFEPTIKATTSQFTILRAFQYKGYRCNLKEIDSVQSYMKNVISSKSRGKFNRTVRKFEKDYKADYHFYGIGAEELEMRKLLDILEQWMIKRFSKLKAFNNNLNPNEWAFHKEATLALFAKKKAGIFAVLADKKPVALTVLYFSNSIAYDIIRSFDMDYASYRPGTICTLKQIEWCIEKGYKYLDFSKGHFDYKERWCNEPYDFEYHILFDRKSLRARFNAYLVFGYYRLKTYLRRLGLDLFWQRLKYLISSRDRLE